MFRDLMLLGKTVAERDGVADSLDLLKDNLGDEYKTGLAICFSSSDAGLKFTGVELRELGSPALPREKVYYVRAPSSRSPDFSPVTRLSALGVEKRLDDLKSAVSRMKGWADERRQSQFSDDCEAVLRGLWKNTDLIIKGLQEKIAASGEKARIFIYVEVDDEPLCARPECKDFLREKAADEYGRIPKSRDPCVTRDGPCAICGEQKALLYGNFSEVKCYNLDKPGGIAGGARTSVAAKNFPVCPECAAWIKNGFKYAGQNEQRVGGERYLVLPRAEDKWLRKRWLRLLDGFKETLSKDELKKGQEKERYFLHKVANEFRNEAQASYRMVFFTAAKAEWKMKADIEEVLPSRVAQVVKSIEETECEVKPWSEREQRMGMSLVRQFASTPGQPDRFLEVIEAVFGGRKRIAEPVALRWVVGRVLQDYKDLARRRAKRPWLSVSTVNGYMFLRFLQRLNVLDRKGVKTMKQRQRTDSRYGRFLSQHAEFFDRTGKEVAFLTGCLVATVLYVQQDARGSAPFFGKLRGLRLDKERLKALFPECQNKLHDYDKEGLARDILSELSQAWVSTAGQWGISDDEATFCFTLGLNLNYYIAQLMDKEEKEQ